MKYVDFLICDAAGKTPLAALELDDKTHNKPKVQQRDKFVNQLFETTSLPLIRIPASNTYDSTLLREMIEKEITQKDTSQ